MAYRSNRLPSRFPIGTKLVIEGPRGGEGQVPVYSRYLEFPDGTCMALPSRAAPPQPGQPRRNRRTRSRRH
jgi:hypothetical protein